MNAGAREIEPEEALDKIRAWAEEGAVHDEGECETCDRNRAAMRVLRALERGDA